MTSRASSGVFKFRNTDSIGATGAEEDTEYLTGCFVDTGHLALLQDATDNRMILLGRTGTGKSALLTMLSVRHNSQVLKISPESLALTYVANSTVLNFFASLGVNLDPFFKLLWRHVLTVELLNHYFAAHPVQPQMSLVDRLREFFSGATRQDKQMKQAITYLEDWGRSFWQETEFRVKEITSTLEGQLKAEIDARLGSKGAGLGGSASSQEKLTQTDRAELLSRGQDIVSKAQVQDLQKVLGLIDSVLRDKQRRYYLVIDGLDENWVEERLRYKLIMALILTAKDFIKVEHAKVIVALRRDLLERVFRLARDSGFQEEKYQSLYLPLTWTKGDIVQVLDRRIQQLVSRRYTGEVVTHRDLLPKSFRDLPIDEYIYSVSRRPRDVIAFFNTCIAAAPNMSRLSTRELKIAEGEYSRTRLRALADEWSADYPQLIDFARILQRRAASFKLESIKDVEVEELCLRVVTENPGGTGLLQQAMQVVDCLVPASAFKQVLVRVFYHIGLIGLKLASHETESWVDELGRSISSPEILDETSAVVNPCYRRALGVID
jgi:hypothetical protein